MNVITKNEVIGFTDFYPRVGHQNLFREGDVSASSEAESGQKENAYDGLTYDFWRTTGGGEQSISVHGVQSGTLQEGWNDRVKLSASASAVRNAYKGMKIRLTAGPSAGQVREIIDYNGDSKIATVDSDWSAFDEQPTFMLELDDLGGGEVNLVPLIGTGSATFTRATTATTVNSAGLIIPVASGIARSYYDPTTLQYRGYLAEGVRTNLFLRSEEFDNASWSKTDTTVTANSIASPDGNVTADLLTQGSAGTAANTRAVTATADATYSVTFFAKRGNSDWLFIGIGAGANSVRGWFNLGTGAVGSTTTAGTGVLSSISIKAYANGFYRCELNASIGSGATSITVSTIIVTGDGLTSRVSGGTYYLWGAQFESGATFPSSYIPTVASAVTRNADVLTYPAAGNAVNSFGTIYTEIAVQNASNLFAAMSISDGTITNAVETNSIVSSARFMVRSSGTQADISAGTISSGVIYKQASSWAANYAQTCKDGTLANQDNVLTVPANFTIIHIGDRFSSLPLFGTIKNVRIWQNQFTGAQLQTLTGSSDYYPIPTDATEYELIGYADYMAIAAHTLAGSTLTPQYSDDGSAWTDFGDAYLVSGNDPVIFEFDGVWADYFRLLIENAPDAISIGAIHCGRMLTIERGLPVGWQPPTLNEDIRFTNTISEGGQTLGRNIISRGASVQVRSSPCTWEFSRKQWDDFIQVANEYACFFWWAYEDYGEVLYGGMTEQDASFSEVNFLQVSFKLEGIIR